MVEFIIVGDGDAKIAINPNHVVSIIDLGADQTLIKTTIDTSYKLKSSYRDAVNKFSYAA
jgi:hypothetical protein